MGKNKRLGNWASYVKKGLAKAGLLDACLAKTGLKEIRSTDLFIASYPKSGNTWVRFMLANALEPEAEITMRNINRQVPGIYNFIKEINATEGHRYIKTHGPFFECYPKTIYIYRDYRDVLISYFHYLQRHDASLRDLGGFIGGHAELTRFGSWEEHVKAAFDFQTKNPERILLIKYEDLLENPAEGLQSILAFSGIDSKRPVKEIVRNTTFLSLQNIEAKHGNVRGDEVAPFFRKGTAQQWHDVFNEAQKALLWEQYGHTLSKLGYAER